MSSSDDQWHYPLALSGSEPLLLFSACDGKYLSYAISLVRSADLFSPGHAFVLHLINPTQTEFDRVQRLAVSLATTRLAVSFEHTDISGLDEDMRRAYYASARFPQIAKILKRYRVPVFSLDADSLIVNPIDFDFSNKADAEVIIIRRDLGHDTPQQLSVATGSIWFKPVPGVDYFLENIIFQIHERVRRRELAWFVDQVVFSQVMEIMKKTVKFYNLKGKYADWEFHENSIVWAGKGDRKENDMRFFLLKALLSDDIELRSLANKLRLNISSAGRQAPGSWWHGRLKAASRSAPRVALYIPRLDMPWKQGGAVAAVPPVLADDALDIRLHWKAFAVRLANAIERAGLEVDVIELPAWKIERKTLEASGAALALVPHRCKLDFDDGETPVFFYMQEFFRWVFVLNRDGWSAASSVYPVDMSQLPEVVAEAGGDSFDAYRHRLQAGELDSKFAQPARRNKKQLLDGGFVPSCKGFLGERDIRPYIFFPLQVPHDQSIRYFSDISEWEVVEAVISWARDHDVAVVMKPHPANRKSMIPFEGLVDGETIFWSDAHVYDLIKHATSIYTINSGVGFEALLHIKPVITFGRVEYDCVSFNATINNLDDAWVYSIKSNEIELEKRYRSFINWFLGEYAVDLSRAARAKSKLDSLAVDIVAQARKLTFESE